MSTKPTAQETPATDQELAEECLWMLERGDAGDKVYAAAIRRLLTDRAEAESQREGLGQQFDETPPCAYVPIHPRTGPLWANVAPTTDSESFPKHYQVRALFMQQLTCPDGGTCHHHCKSPCARRDALGCVPLTASGLNDDWTPPEPRA